MRITALQRGGLAVYGGHYDARLNEAVAALRAGESLAVTINFGAPPVGASITGISGAYATTPTVSGSSATTTISGAAEGSFVDVTATVIGAIRTVRVRIGQTTMIDGYDSPSDTPTGSILGGETGGVLGIE